MAFDDPITQRDLDRFRKEVRQDLTALQEQVNLIRELLWGPTRAALARLSGDSSVTKEVGPKLMEIEEGLERLRTMKRAPTPNP